LTLTEEQRIGTAILGAGPAGLSAAHVLVRAGRPGAVRKRLSRIYYRGRFFNYPLRAEDVFRRLGPWESELDELKRRPGPLLFSGVWVFAPSCR
jgi:2-polyprenyl-6-methoxyphenol hydroxylase-like FAD-dependent oxidoreductase